MSPIIVEAGTVANIVGMIILLDEVFNLLALLFIILSFVLVVDFGFYIEEGSAAVSAALAAVAL